MNRLLGILVLAGHVLCSCGGASPTSPTVLSDAPALNEVISTDELACFQPGNDLDAIRKALNHRGDFLATYSDASGNEVTIMSYRVTLDRSNPTTSDGNIARAVYRGARFERFVPGSNWKKGHIGAKGLSVEEGLRRARATVAGPPLDMDSIYEEPVPRPVDWALMVAAAPTLLGMEEARSQEFIENAKIRMRFDGSTIRLGDAQSEVEDRFGHHLDAWDDGDYSVRAYGSHQRFEVSSHHRRVVVAYKDQIVANVFFAAWLGYE